MANIPPWRFNRRQIAPAFEGRGVLLSSKQEEQFATFLEGICRWNQSVRLTGIRNPEEILKALLVESAEFLNLWEPPASGRAVDVGSGAGIPGLPLKILRPHLFLSVVEANERKTAFLKEQVRQLSLHGVEVLCARAEDLCESEDHRGRYHAAFSRGVGPLGRLLPWVWPFLVQGGIFLLRQGKQYIKETEDALRQWEGLGVQVAGERPMEKGRLIALQKGDVSRETPLRVG